jgi:hypothetical protein
MFAIDGSRVSPGLELLIAARTLPPLLGVEACAVDFSNAGDTAAVRPRADTLVKNSRRVIFPSVNKLSSFVSFDIFYFLLYRV